MAENRKYNYHPSTPTFNNHRAKENFTAPN